MFVCIYVCIYICLYVCMYVYVWMYLCMYVYIVYRQLGNTVTKADESVVTVFISASSLRAELIITVERTNALLCEEIFRITTVNNPI